MVQYQHAFAVMYTFTGTTVYISLLLYELFLSIFAAGFVSFSSSASRPQTISFFFTVLLPRLPPPASLYYTLPSTLLPPSV